LTAERSGIVSISSFCFGGGVDLPVKSGREWIEFQKKLARFKGEDFKVKLGSILEKDMRDYYVEHRFGFLEEKLATMI